MKMKKSLSAILTVFALLLASCSNWMKDDNLYSDIENDVKVANAAKINVYVRYAMTRQGKTDPDGSAIFKVQIPHEISATTETEYGFVRWAAFSTDFLATGDNQSKNKDFLFIDEEDYNTRLLPHEIQAPVVVFEDPYNPVTKVTINQKRDDLFLVPIVTQRPAVSLTIPARGSGGVVRNMSVRISFTKPMDEDSFKNAEGAYDTISITQGTQTFTSEGDIEIDSEDITSRFQNPVFSKNKKMITLQFKDEEVEEGFASQSSVTITISKEVKDLYGFTMVDDEKVSFTVGSNKDTLAPRITSLTGGNGKDFAKFQGVYQDAVYKEASGSTPATGVIEHIGQKTKIKYQGAKNAPTDNVEASFFGTFGSTESSNFYANRVGDKIIIRVYAEDIAGSGEEQSSDGIETDVSLIGIRAKLLYDADGKPSDESLSLTSYPYIPQGNQTSLSGSYKDLVMASYGNASPEVETSKGTLLEYDLKDLSDGLIQIDVAAVDLIANSGFGAGGYYSNEYGNGYASLFVVKDTVAPELLTSGNVEMFINNSTIDQSKYYNATDYSKIELAVKTSVKDQGGHERLRSQKVEWIVQPAEQPISASQSNWKKATPSEKFGSLTPPTVDKTQHFVYALKDDLGNISKETLPEFINYDCTKPAFGNLTWQVPTGSTPGITTGNVLTDQTLVIPLTEVTSGIQSLDISVYKDNGGQVYAPLKDDFKIYYAGSELNSTLYTLNDSKTVLSIKTPRVTSAEGETIKINGLQLADTNPTGNYDGLYTVKVSVTDAANNTSVVAQQTISNDSTKPVIQKIFIPNIRKAVRFEDSGNTPEYWIDYTKLSSLTGYSNPITDLEVTFNESNSGALVFDFSNSTVKLTSGSKLYKGNTEIPATVNESYQTLTINNPSDAIRNDPSAASVKVQIKNAQIQLDSNNDAKVDIRISDTATNISDAFASITSSEGATEIPGIGKFKYDKESISSSSYTLKDKETETNCAAAEDGYTNNAHINAKITLCTTTKASGVYSITIDGPAEFDSTTTIKNNSGDSLTFDISDDKKTATFYKEVSGVKTHMLFNNDASSGKDVNISNLKLTGGEGSKSITLKAGHLSGVVNSGETQSIVLDTTPPAWVGKGLYVSYSNADYAKKVYPHPMSGEKVYGIDFGTNNTDGNTILYFYDQSSYSSIVPDVSDDNIADTFYWKKATATSYATGTALSSSAYTGHLMVYAKDKAGNKSSIIDFYRQPVSSLRTGLDALEHNAELIPPDTYTKDKNTFLNSHRVPMEWKKDTYVYWGSDHDNIWVINYILRKAPAGQNYKLKIDVSPYTAADETYDPIEYYGITTIYSTYPSTKENHAEDSLTPNIDTVTWRDYNTKNTTKTDYQIDSIVDDSGDIILTLPNHDLPPISLFLKDGVGNTKYIILNPGLKAKLGRDREVYESVGWFMDDKVGSVLTDGTQYDNVDTTDINSASSGYMTAPGNDVTFYKQNSNNTYLVRFGGTNGFSDVCRFSIDSSSLGSDTVYSMRSRILAWTGDSAPDQSDFESATGSAASDWYSYMEKLDSGNFKLQNYLPKYDSVDPNGYGLPYKLYYIIEDRVGNFEIRQLKYNNIDNWLYDNVEPALDVKTSQFVNNIDNKNYYSNSSTVKYEITDKMSGIKNNGTSNKDYTSFNARDTIFAKAQGENIRNLTINGTTIYIQDVEDYAGNKAGAVGLSYEGSNIWIYQPNAPAFASSSPVQITAINPPSGKKFETGYSSGEWYINSSRKITHIQLKMTMDDSESLLGWIIKNDDSVPENKIYTVADTQSQNGNPAVLTPIPHSGKVYTYSIDKTKKSGNQIVEDTNTTWNNYFNKKPLKFFAVNRAGIINTEPIVIKFEELPVPELDGNLEYSGVINYPSSNSTDNYIKSASKVIFKTKENPDKCTIVVGTESVTFTLSEYLNTSTGQYEIPLGTDNKLKAASGAALKLVLSITNGEDSGEIELKGPANKNKWTFDETAPSISASVKTKNQAGNTDALTNKFDSSDKTYYIEGDKAVITFATSDTDIAKWEQKLSTDADTAYEDMIWTGDKTITLDVNKTYNFRAIDKAGNISAVQTVALKKDVSAPDGSSFTYKLKKGDDETEADYYTDNNGTIVYNTSKVDSIELILTGVNDPDGNGLHFFSKLGENAAGEFNPSVSNGVKTYKITLSSTNNYNAKYVISVKDNLGHETILKSFDFTADASTPAISIASVQSQRENYTVYDGYLNGGVYYLCRDDAIITFASTATDIKAYQVKSTDGSSWITVSDGNVHRFNCTAITSATTYTFRAVDNVGHASSELSCDLIYDGAGPEGSLTQKLYKDSTEKTAFDSSANPLVPGDYTLSTDENQIITVTYNSNNVNKIVFADDSVTDSLSGYTAGSLFYKKGSGQETALTGKALELTADMGSDVYEIIAKDNTGGNKTTIAKYKFVADVTGPEITSGVTTVSWHDRNVKQVNGYTSTMGTIPYAKWVSKDQRKRASYYTSGTKLMFAKTAIPGAIQYQMVQTETTGNTKTTDGYTATAGNTWQNMVVSDDGNSFVFALPDIHTPYTRLSLFFRDELGNVSDAYYLGNNTSGQQGIQWWIIGAPISAGDITITSITYNNNGTVTNGWGGKLHDYTVTLTLPVGTLIKSVFLVPKPGNANTGVVFSTNLPQGVNTSLQFSGYGTETDVVENNGKKEGIKGNYDSEGFLVLPSSPESETGTITMIIYPHDVEDDNKVNILVKFNVENADADGVSKQLFKADGTINASMHSGFLGKIISAFGADQKDQGTAFSGQDSSYETSANSGWFRNITSSSSASSVTSSALAAGAAGSSTKKAAKAAKAAQKAAEKAAKKTAKTGAKTATKTTVDTVKESPLVQEIASQLEDLPLPEEVIKEDISPVTAKTDFVMSPVEKVEIADTITIESAASSTEQAQPEKSSSKNALIVVMLAILSAAAGLLVTLKKKRA